MTAQPSDFDALTAPIDTVTNHINDATIARQITDARNPETTESPINRAFTHAHDQVSHLEQALSVLNATVMRAGSILEPVLTGGEYEEPAGTPVDDENAARIDDRSTIARRVAAIADHNDRLAESVLYITRRLDAILAAVEL